MHGAWSIGTPSRTPLITYPSMTMAWKDLNKISKLAIVVVGVIIVFVALIPSIRKEAQRQNDETKAIALAERRRVANMSPSDHLGEIVEELLNESDKPTYTIEGSTASIGFFDGSGTRRMITYHTMKLVEAMIDSRHLRFVVDDFVIEVKGVLVDQFGAESTKTVYIAQIPRSV